MVTANLLGLPFLGQRFEMLHAAYMLRLEEARTDDPLRLALRPEFPPAMFAYHFQRSLCFDRWKPTRPPALKDARKSLERFLLYYREDLVVETAKSRHLTAVIPFGAREEKGQDLISRNLCESSYKRRHPGDATSCGDYIRSAIANGFLAPLLGVSLRLETAIATGSLYFPSQEVRRVHPSVKYIFSAEFKRPPAPLVAATKTTPGIATI